MTLTLLHTIFYFGAMLSLLVMSVVVVVSTIQVIVYNKRHEKREVEHAMREVEYHHKRMRG